MRISLVSAFPELLRSYLECSILGRAVANGKLDVAFVDIRDYAEGTWRQIDDYSYGGEGGMLLMAEPLERAIEAICAAGGEKRPYVVYPSPQGAVLHQELVEDLSRKEHLVLVAGHYEGVDERLIEKRVDLEVSLGDFVLTGGELPALAIVDAVARLIPGVVGKSGSVAEDSFYRGMLDCPHYTRPATWGDQRVPEVLTEGDAAQIEAWRRKQSVARTLARRSDLLFRAGIRPYLAKGIYVVLAHHPVLDRHGQKSTTAITGLDLHDIARACRTYGVTRYLVATPFKSQRDMIAKIKEHWTTGYGLSFNPDRGEALKSVKAFGSVEKALDWVATREKAAPYVVGTTAKARPESVHWTGLKRTLLALDRPCMLLFGTGWGLHEEVFAHCDAVLTPIRGGVDPYNHLSVRNAVSVVLDRLFGWR